MKLEEALEEIERQGIQEKDLILAIWRETKKNKPHMNRRIGIGLFVPFKSAGCPGFTLYPNCYYSDGDLKGFETKSFPVHYENLISIQRIGSYQEYLAKMEEIFH